MSQEQLQSAYTTDSSLAFNFASRLRSTSAKHGASNKVPLPTSKQSRSAGATPSEHEAGATDLLKPFIVGIVTISQQKQTKAVMMVPRTLKNILSNALPREYTKRFIEPTGKVVAHHPREKLALNGTTFSLRDGQ